MRSRRVGLAHTTGFPGKRYRYTFIPGHNETVQVHNPSGLPIEFYRCPRVIQAEINMSMGHAGMKYCDLPWYKRLRFDMAALLDGLRSQLGMPLDF